MPRRDAKLVWFAGNSSRFREIKVTKSRIILCILCLVMFLGSAMYFSVKYISTQMTKSAMAGVIDENIHLKQQLKRVDNRIKELDANMQILSKSDDELRLIADIPKIDKDIRQVGVGGSVDPSYKGNNYELRRIFEDLDKIEREVRLQFVSYSEIQKQLNSNQRYLDHFPSIRPVQSGYISSHFGRRRDPFTGKWAHHNGIDFSTEKGSPIYAAANGKVVFARRTPGLGNLVIIDHGFGYRTVYGHLDVISVSNKQTVERWQKIGEVGNTGRSTAPHLHYEVQVHGTPQDPLDFFWNEVPLAWND